MFPRSISRNHNINNGCPLRFPQKLWKIANECRSGAVSWSPHGRSILLRYSQFKEEFMSSKSNLFKTDNISSFVRQLNLYGFKKVYDHTHKHVYKASADLHEFSNVYFQRDRPDLLDKVTRKSGILKDKNGFFEDFSHSSQEEFEFVDEELEASFDEENYLPNGHNGDFEGIIKFMESPSIIPLPLNFNDQDSLILSETLEPVAQAIEPPPEAPPKKKRGRKPGSKIVKHPKSVSIPKSTKYHVPVLRFPEVSTKFIYFDDDRDDTYLRHVSRDVMLSSTLPFQETAEYLELKETYQRLYQPRIKLRYSSLPVSIPYQTPHHTINKTKLYNLRI